MEYNLSGNADVSLHVFVSQTKDTPNEDFKGFHSVVDLRITQIREEEEINRVIIYNVKVSELKECCEKILNHLN